MLIESNLCHKKQEECGHGDTFVSGCLLFWTAAASSLSSISFLGIF